VKYASQRGWSVHAPATGVIPRRGQQLTERLPGAGAAIRVLVRDRPRALELLARKGWDSRKTAWRDFHTAYKGVVRERWLASRDVSPSRSAKDTRGGSSACGRPSAGANVCPATAICVSRFADI
jgi:hypothetical protein